MPRAQFDTATTPLRHSPIKPTSPSASYTARFAQYVTGQSLEEAACTRQADFSLRIERLLLLP
ncbi:hypothetical protein C8Q73DRAFT_707054 [Cubamyces lactineus]|nr:hypothetical protein C8Q73DRAFT_707054 [Cubamyces lactineus]